MTVVYVVDSSGGGDYTTIAAALAAVPDNPADVYEIQLEDEVHDIASDLDIDVSGCTATNYIHITAKAGAEPSGFDTGAAIRTATTGHGFVVSSSYTKFSKVRMQHRSATSSSEMIRCNGEFVWADRCFVEDTNNSGSRDGFQCANEDTFLTCTNSVFRNFQRNGLRVQTDSPYSSANPPTLHSYHNTLIDCGANSASTADKGGMSSSSYANNANAFCKMVAFNTFGDSTGNGGKTSAWRQFETQLTGGGDAIFEATNCVAGEPAGFGFDAAVDTTDISSGRPRTATEPTANGTWMDDNGVLLGENGFTTTQNTFDLTVHTFLDSRISTADFATDILGNPRVSGGSVGAYAIPSSGETVTPVETAQTQSSDSPSITQSHVATPVETAQAQASDTTALTQSSSVNATETNQTQSSDTTSLSQGINVAPTETAQAQSSDSPAITQASTLTPVGTNQTQSSDSPGSTTVDPGSVAAVGTNQAQSSDQTSLVQANAVAPVKTVQTQSSDTTVVSPLPPATLAPVGTNQGQSSDQATFILATTLVLISTSQTQSSDDAATTGGSTGVIIVETDIVFQLETGWDYEQITALIAETIDTQPALEVGGYIEFDTVNGTRDFDGNGVVSSTAGLPQSGFVRVWSPSGDVSQQSVYTQEADSILTPAVVIQQIDNLLLQLNTDFSLNLSEYFSNAVSYAISQGALPQGFELGTTSIFGQPTTDEVGSFTIEALGEAGTAAVYIGPIQFDVREERLAIVSPAKVRDGRTANQAPNTDIEYLIVDEAEVTWVSATVSPDAELIVPPPFGSEEGDRRLMLVRGVSTDDRVGAVRLTVQVV